MSTKKKMLQAAAGNAGGAGLNVEEVFSTYLYTGNDSTQTITNGIDLAGEGGIAWFKLRNPASDHSIFMTDFGNTSRIIPNETLGLLTGEGGVSSFNSDGFSLNANSSTNGLNNPMASWTFRKAPKFFDVVTYTGDGVSTGRNIAHDLGVAPAFIIVKRTDTTGDWAVSHISNSGVGLLNSSDAFSTSLGSGFPAFNGYTYVQSLSTDTTFYVAGGDGGVSNVNASGGTYVAYLFAHNDGDGEFGPDGDADIIKCGSFTAGSSGVTQQIDLGWEPQWVLVKNVDDVYYAEWRIYDVMRGMSETASENLKANASDAAEVDNPLVTAYSQGFKGDFSAGGLATNDTYIYIAIRRGTKVPESGTEVFDVATYIGTASSLTPQSLEAADLGFQKTRNAASSPAPRWYDRLRGSGVYLRSSSTSGEAGTNPATYNFNASQVIEVDGLESTSGDSYVSYNWKRAPNFFDVVAYTGVGGGTVSHNLGVAPEMMWIKNRDNGADIAYGWWVYHADLGATNRMYLNGTQAVGASTVFNNTAPTDSVFSVSGSSATGSSGDDYIAYLFASLDGVSKVFSVTKSSGSDASVNCGFSSGPRFVMLKRTDSTGDWYVWDTERGIIAGNDPYLLLNSTAAEVTSTDYIDPTSNGFTIVNGGLADGDYIGYAVA